MGALVKFTLSGPKWWVDTVNELFLRFQKAVAEGKLELPLMVTDDATDGQILHVAMDKDGNFNAMASDTLTQSTFPPDATIFSGGKKYPLKNL
jgi:hypothetical protein